jgi:hypothetical protein
MQAASSPSDTRGPAEFAAGSAPGVIDARSHYVRVDGIRTHYLDAGDGPTVVLLHDGSYGASGQLCCPLMEPIASEVLRGYRLCQATWPKFPAI